jgi:phosphocarrier protein FPr
MDLGSAILSAELAIDLLDPDISAQVVLCPGPLVEGLVVAGVSAAGGASVSDVADEAASALAGKQSHLGAETPVGAREPEQERPEQEERAEFVLSNEHGLHARPAARLVSELRDFDARVTLENLTTGSGRVPAGSLSRVATLGALKDHRVAVSASGAQAKAAVDHVLALAERRFDESPETGPSSAATGARSSATVADVEAVSRQETGPLAVPPLDSGAVEPRIFERLTPDPDPPRKMIPSRRIQSRIDSIESSMDRMKQLWTATLFVRYSPDSV